MANSEVLPANIKAFLFDLDGTLLDSIGALKETFYSFLEINDRKATDANFEDFIGQRIDEIVENLKKKFAWQKSSSVLLDEYNVLLAEKYFDSSPSHSAVRLLNALASKDVQIALVTSAAMHNVAPILERLGWQKIFKTIVTGDMAANTKPSPDLYQLALERLKVSPSEAVAIEDSVSGVRSASSAGIFTVATLTDANAQELSKAGAQIVLRNLDELFKIAEKSFDWTWHIKPVNNDFKVIIKDTSKTLSSALNTRVQQIWDIACAKNPRLFNGSFVNCTGFDDHNMYCKIIPYSHFYAQLADASLKDELQINAAAVSGVCTIVGKFLMGKRSQSLSQQPGWYELLPSGGLDPDKKKEDGSIDFFSQLKSELHEESGFSSDLIEEMNLLGIIFNFQDDIVDICVEMKLSSDALKIDLAQNDTNEYEKLFWLDKKEVLDFIQSEPLIVPTSRTLLNMQQSQLSLSVNQKACIDL